LRRTNGELGSRIAAEAIPNTARSARGELVGPPVCPTVSIVCTDDRVVRAEWGRWAARERLIDAPVVELGGSHSPFLSRPEELVEAIRGALTQLEG
jgi:pimeloyl-ACP methyl ester carboxylesterase